MDESSHDRHWLENRLDQLSGGSIGFTVVNSPLRPVVERGNPWNVEFRQHELRAFLEHLQAPGEGEKGRIALITDVEEDPVARVQTAVLLAQRLAEQGQSVLLVDADVRHVGLSRWLSDRDLDAEGLVDILQYGSSIAAVRRRGPIENVDIIGVGSYRPDETDLFHDDELRRLVSQLRGEADVILLIGPSWLQDERLHPLLVHGDTVVVSLHLDRSLGARLQELLEYLEGLNVPVAGLMTYAGPDAAERRVDDLFESDDEPDPSASGPTQAVDTVDASEAPAPPVRAADESPSGGFSSAPTPSQGSSPVFRVAAVVAVMIIVGFIGWWGLAHRGDVPPRPLGAPNFDTAAGDLVPEETPGEILVADAVDSSDRVVEPTELEASAGSAVEAGGSLASTVTTAEPTVEAPVEVDVLSADEAETKPPVPVASGAPEWAGAFDRPVGRGYALYFYSFPDSSEALVSASRLERDGFSPAVRGAQIQNRGRWYRVLVGRFETRAQALDARESLAERVGVDWVGVVRVR